MSITIIPELFTIGGLLIIEEKYQAKYVCETCIGVSAKEPGMWNWKNWPVAVFYQPDLALVPEDGSQYFGMYFKRHLPDSPLTAYICNASSAAQTNIVGILADDGEVIYSHYRHDFRTSKDKSVWIDGGRDYTRYDGKSTLIDLRIKEGELVINQEGGCG